MTWLYFYLVLINAGVTFAAGAAVFWRNRSQPVGPMLGLALLVKGLWLIAFANYLIPLTRTQALLGGQLTLSCALLAQPLLLHAMIAAVNEVRRRRWLITAGYIAAAFFLVLLWRGHIIAGLKSAAYMNHYIQYNRTLYPLLGLHFLVWQFLGAGLVGIAARQGSGYKRTQLVYFLVAWFIEFLILNSILLPLEYNISVQPFGLFVLPLNTAFLAYVMGKARLADYNVVIARVLLHAVTLLVVIVMCLLSTTVMTFVAPKFMNQAQILFSVLQAVGIGLVLAFALPRWLPRAERMMQERFFGKRYGYQDALAGMVKELSRLPSLDEVLQQVATMVHSQMQVSRVMIFIQNPLSGTYQLQSESGLTAQERDDLFELNETSPVVAWLADKQDDLVRDELGRRFSAAQSRELKGELDRLQVAVCVPMVLDGRLAGVISVGPKVNLDMFFISDLKVLDTLATEVALAVKYRRMEDQIFRKNKLIELGTIAAGVAHEIRNPLASIRTFAQLMPDKMDDPEFKDEFSKLVLKDVDRITKVVESMLAFARPGQVTIAEHSAMDLVEEAILLVQPRIKAKRIEVTKQFHEQPTLRVDKQQILQVLVNLISNAADALPERGKIRLVTGIGVMEGAGANNGSQRIAVIEVADNGPGIPPAVRNRLFDPFFTTKKEGTGLGLSISQKIVRDHGGIISVSSVEGKGTTFRINLPLS